jgi:hypothetical protein
MIALLLLLLLLPAGAQADCISSSAYEYGLSPLLVEAIQQVESDGNPFAINVQIEEQAEFRFREFLERLSVRYSVSRGRYVIFSIFPESREQAEEILRFVYRNPAVRSYDVGLMQINKYWIEKYGLRPEWLLNRCYNVKWGTYILSSLVQRYGYTWEAVWRYNGSRKYADRVLRRIESLCRVKYSDNKYCQKYFNIAGR